MKIKQVQNGEEIQRLLDETLNSCSMWGYSLIYSGKCPFSPRFLKTLTPENQLMFLQVGIVLDTSYEVPVFYPEDWDSSDLWEESDKKTDL